MINRSNISDDYVLVSKYKLVYVESGTIEIKKVDGFDETLKDYKANCNKAG